MSDSPCPTPILSQRHRPSPFGVPHETARNIRPVHRQFPQPTTSTSKPRYHAARNTRNPRSILHAARTAHCRCVCKKHDATSTTKSTNARETLSQAPAKFNSGERFNVTVRLHQQNAISGEKRMFSANARRKKRREQRAIATHRSRHKPP